MRELSKSFAIGAALVLVGCAPSPVPGARVAPPTRSAEVARAAEGSAPATSALAMTEIRNVIFMLADGAGMGFWSAAAHGRENPAFASMQVVGLVGTRSARHRVPDSAATASAYATGELVTNRVVSMVDCPMPQPRDPAGPVPPGCEPVSTWFDLARDRRLARGVVTTTYVVDASPAAFVAHSPSRYWTQEIAEQFVAADLDVMLGGGRRFFEAAIREDGADLLGSLCGRAHCVATAAELARYEPDSRPLVGLFTAADMGPLHERPVSLPAMTAAALSKLALDPDGFVVLIETEGTDNSGHDNEPLEPVTAEMLEFDDAVEVALRFADRHPGTLVIVTADHDTGGFTIQETPSGDSVVAGYTTRGHTAAMVPLFAYGAGAERFGGVRSNVEIGRLLKEIVSGR